MDRNRNQPCDKQLTSDLLAIEMQRLSLVRVATNPDSVTSTTSKRKPKKNIIFTHQWVNEYNRQTRILKREQLEQNRRALVLVQNSFQSEVAKIVPKDDQLKTT
tara:strand:- start:1161 stop:1472 length:312 start_codon:yes stop_codon:yes gene_type:complete